MCWALDHLPVGTLKELRSMHGYDRPPVRHWHDFTIRERSG